MRVSRVTAHARAICDGSGLECRYELEGERWRWNFYRDGERVAGTVQHWLVADLAQKVVDSGKLLTYS